MPYTVAVSFDRFLENITIGGDMRSIAVTRRDAILELLGNAFTIVEAFPMGSLARGTALKGFADVDVLVALHWGNHAKDRTPRELLGAVRDHLGAYDARIVKKNGQAVTLYFKTWPNVDIVPGYQVVKEDKTVACYQIADATQSGWLRTEPHSHARVMTQAFTRSPALPRLIRMVKEWNRNHSAYMQSFHIEAIARSLDPNEFDWPWAVFKAFEHLATISRTPLIYPVTSGQQADDYLSSVDRGELIKRLDVARDRARGAWYATYGERRDHEGAIEKYRKIFGDRFPAYG